MKLSELIYAFDMDYLLECAKRDAKRIDFTNGHKALMLSKAVSELQKRFGIIEMSLELNSEDGNNFYGISSSFMNPKSVLYNGCPLEKASTEWINNAMPFASSPLKYAIQYLDNSAGLLLYPTPISNNDTIQILCNFDYGLYSPSTTNNDFGKFDGSTFSGETVFPTIYDRAILLNMISQIYNDTLPMFERECSLLRVKAYNGEKFSYNMSTKSDRRIG